MPGDNAKTFQRVAEKLGFSISRQKGSHQRWIHKDGRATTIPIHPSTNIEPPLYYEIIKQMGITSEEFNQLK